MAAADDRNRILSPRDMKQIAEALGTQCAHCHTARNPGGKPDYRAPSPMKETAKYMKTHFVDGLVTRDGKPVTCATCHAGRAEFLPEKLAADAPKSAVQGDRMEIMKRMNGIAKALGVRCDFCHAKGADGKLAYDLPTGHKQVAKYMMTEFVGKLKLKNGEDLTCATCHAGRAEFLPHRGAEGEGHEHPKTEKKGG
jgi:mono/diheme cytochrome c family protein